MSKNSTNNHILIQQEHESANEYISTMELEKQDGLVLLTKANAAKIEAMIHLNPRYGKTVDKTNTNSAMYSINELKNNEKLYDQNHIQEIIKRINRENSTRLSEEETAELAARVISSNKTFKKLKENLKKKDYSLIDVLADSVTTKTKTGKDRRRKNFSFATKFCHYMCFYLFEREEAQDNYSIYDNIVINVLPDYMKKGEKALTPFNKYNKGKPSDYYKEYQSIIDIILEYNKEKISRNAFDHIMWYYTKTQTDQEQTESDDIETED